MLWRLILVLFIGYLGYQAIKKLVRSMGLGSEGEPPPRTMERTGPDVLVQDPVCNTFIPRNDALKTRKDGKDYFFCSEGCMKRFLRGGRD